MLKNIESVLVYQGFPFWEFCMVFRVLQCSEILVCGPLVHVCNPLPLLISYKSFSVSYKKDMFSITEGI